MCWDSWERREAGQKHRTAEDNSNVQYDASGEPIYYYEWNGTRMTKEEYAKALNDVYDMSKAKDGYEYGKTYTAEQVIQLLEGM